MSPNQASNPGRDHRFCKDCGLCIECQDCECDKGKLSDLEEEE